MSAPAMSRVGGFIFRATVLVAVLTIAGSVLGLVRDLALARLFGATAETDAFLVAWTVPETASPLLIEAATAFLLVPIFVRALASGDGLLPAVRATLPRIAAVLVAASAVVVVAAPAVVRMLAPGIAEYDLAVSCTRITAVSVLAFGLAGYLGAALRAAHRFGWAAAIYIAYNIGILAALGLLHERIGVVSAAIGIAVGGLLMVAVQLPSFRRLLTSAGPGRLAFPAHVAVGAFVPIATYTIARQAQVWVERFLGSELAAGTISHLNYAQKVAQVPMTLSVLVATVTYPMLARSVQSGDTAGSRERTGSDLRMVAAIVLVSTAYVITFASPIIEVLFENGAFTERDTAATANTMRIYALGLLGQAAVAVLTRSFFCDGRPAWFPAVVMGAGLAVTAALSFALAPVWHAGGIAAGNAAGITLTAVLMLGGVRARLGLPLAATSAALGRLAAAAVAAGIGGWMLLQLMASVHPVVTLLAGALVVTGLFLAVGTALRAEEARRLATIGWRSARAR